MGRFLGFEASMVFNFIHLDHDFIAIRLWFWRDKHLVSKQGLKANQAFVVLESLGLGAIDTHIHVMHVEEQIPSGGHIAGVPR